MNTIIVWLLALMIWKAPPAKLAEQPQIRGYEETADEKHERYQSFVADLFAVTYDPAERPLFAGARGRARTAATMLGIAFHESGFAKDVDVGPCAQGRCDGGLSACTMQIRVGDGQTQEGYSKADLFADRTKCFRAALHRLRRSFSACNRLGAEFIFDAYAGGGCGGGAQHRAGLELRGFAAMFEGRAPLPGPDLSFLAPRAALAPAIGIGEMAASAP